MKLFIVESPNKCAKLQKILGNEYKVVASVGHIRSIPEKGLNIDINNGFAPTFEIMSGKEEVVSKIKRLSDEAGEIILATDPDREGEAISWHLLDILSAKNQKKCTRVAFDEITKSAVEKAIENKRSIDMNLVNAQKARQILDRLIGYKISPLLWFKVAPKTSAGRVQSVALKLICQKDNEINAFKPSDYWYLEAKLKAEEGEFKAKVLTEDKDNKYLDEKLASDDYNKIKKSKIIIDKIEKNERIVSPYPPFDTSSLQTTASTLFSWGAKKTMQVAQDLYSNGNISYLRTDSFHISDEAMKSVRDFIKDKFDKKYLPSSPRKFSKKSKAAAQEAHECIRPTHIEDEGAEIIGDNLKLYKLIRDRFLACQMESMIVDTVQYHIGCDSGHKMLSKGQSVRFDGWNKIYKYSKTNEEVLPKVSEKEKLLLVDLDKTKHTTQPPSRFNEGSLIKKLESDGIGRPSTYASILESIQKKGYAEKAKASKGALTSTDLGMKIFNFLDPNFNKDFFMDMAYTAEMEDELDKVASGERNILEVLQKAYDIILKEINKIGPDKTGRSYSSTDKSCSVCKTGMIVEKLGKFGKFYACDKYPTCKAIFVVNKEKEGEFVPKTNEYSSSALSTGRKCPKCKEEGRKGEMLKRKNKKDDSFFYGCSAYPKCKHTEKMETSEKSSKKDSSEDSSEVNSETIPEGEEN